MVTRENADGELVSVAYEGGKGIMGMGVGRGSLARSIHSSPENMGWPDGNF